VADLCAEIAHLKRVNEDLELALLTSNEHSDLLQDHLYRASQSLAAEVRERQVVEDKMQKLLQAITREKGDLEILVQILIDQGDASAAEGEKARIDSLTLIPNRRRFDEYVSHEWMRHRRLQQPVSLLICDVDHFKLFNDHYGHQSGDDCLRAVARVINNSVRRSGDLVARYGGEEFGVILPGTDLAGALQTAEEVRAAVMSAAIPHARSPVCRVVSLSIGAASQTPPLEMDLDVQVLIEEADRALYLAKRSGRNCVGNRQRGE